MFGKYPSKLALIYKIESWKGELDMSYLRNKYLLRSVIAALNKPVLEYPREPTWFCTTTVNNAITICPLLFPNYGQHLQIHFSPMEHKNTIDTRFKLKPKYGNFPTYRTTPIHKKTFNPPHTFNNEWHGESAF